MEHTKSLVKRVQQAAQAQRLQLPVNNTATHTDRAKHQADDSKTYNSIAGPELLWLAHPETAGLPDEVSMAHNRHSRDSKEALACTLAANRNETERGLSAQVATCVQRHAAPRLHLNHQKG